MSSFKRFMSGSLTCLILVGIMSSGLFAKSYDDVKNDIPFSEQIVIAELPRSNPTLTAIGKPSPTVFAETYVNFIIYASYKKSKRILREAGNNHFRASFRRSCNAE